MLVVADPHEGVPLRAAGPSGIGVRASRSRTLEPIALEAITVNPVAPQSHRFDSAQLRALLAQAIADVPIFDVLHPEYRGVHPAGTAAAHPGV